MLIGTPEDQTFKDPHQLRLEDVPDVLDDFDIDCKCQDILPSDNISVIDFQASCYLDDGVSTARRPETDPRNKKIILQKLREQPVEVSLSSYGFIEKSPPKVTGPFCLSSLLRLRDLERSYWFWTSTTVSVLSTTSSSRLMSGLLSFGRLQASAIWCFASD